MLMAMTVVAILAGIAIPKAGDLIKRARAAVVASEIRAVRDAVAVYYVDSLSYPPTAALGQMPPALEPYIGGQVAFIQSGYQLQYNNWTVHWSMPGYPSTLSIIGVTVHTDDARLGQLVMQVLSSTPHFQWGENYTFIVVGL
jgi:type II secretory pathway pseudopilin PulG